MQHSGFFCIWEEIAYMRDLTVLAYSEGLITVFKLEINAYRTVYPRSTEWTLQGARAN